MCSLDEERPHKKKLKPCSSRPRPCWLDSLPSEIALSCFARVSRSDHPSLSMVSKSHRSLRFSPELYDVRSELGFTENCIFLCLSIRSDPLVRWFSFCLKPLNSPRRLVPIRPLWCQPSEGSSVVALGWGIYIIGGRIGGGNPSSRVFFLDCRSHKWSYVPSMLVKRESAAVGVVDGKIYVFGGCKLYNSPWGEVFDPKMQTWEALPMTPAEYGAPYPLIYESAVIEEKVFGADATGTGLFYSPSEGKWLRGNKNYSRTRKSWYVIENVMYSCVLGGRIEWCEASELEWREPEGMEWREVMGLEALRDTLSASKVVNFMWNHWESLFSCSNELDDVFPGHKLSNIGPNMLLFWDVLSPKKLEIWCAEISLEKRKKTGEIWGNIEWSEAVMTLDPPPRHHHHCKILHSVSLNL